MRILKLFLISAVVLFMLIAAISLLLPSHVRISRAVNFSADKQKIWQQVDDLRGWSAWNPFFVGLPAEDFHFPDSGSGTPSSLEIYGTSVRWLEIKPDERIALMSKGKQLPLQNGWKCIEHPGSDSTTLQWYMEFKLHWYPWEKFASLMFERSYGPRMEEGLGNLKKMLETNRPSAN